MVTFISVYASIVGSIKLSRPYTIYLVHPGRKFSETADKQMLPDPFKVSKYCLYLLNHAVVTSCLNCFPHWNLEIIETFTTVSLCLS